MAVQLSGRFGWRVECICFYAVEFTFCQDVHNLIAQFLFLAILLVFGACLAAIGCVSQVIESLTGYPKIRHF